MRKVIIDCDPGIDDSLALMLALSSPEIEVIGITIVCGNTPVDMGFENAKKILKFIHRLDIPIYKGATQPLKKPYVDALDTHGADGLGESFLDPVPGYEQKMDAIEFLSKTLKQEPCTVIAIGPMTNFAQLIAKDPAAFEAIDTFISMGGTYKAHGNCSPVGEYNYWEDPEAAKIVYAHTKMIHMIGLDVTRQIVLTHEILDAWEPKNKKVTDFIRKITSFYFTFHWHQEHLKGCVINDPLAIAYVIDPSICSGFKAYTDIKTDGITRGESVVDAYDFYHKPANAKILTQVDVSKFFTLFESRVIDHEEN